MICVPDALFGRKGTQHGPVDRRVDMTDVAEAAAFFLGPDGAYLSGQVLFVDGGRHLFSSMSA